MSGPTSSTPFLDRLAASDREIDSHDVMVVLAHPDDESIALGGQLARLEGVRLVHVTDGAPENMSDALASGFPTRERYAEARRRELAAAMAEAGVGAGQMLSLGLTDQSAARRLPALASRLASLFNEHGVRTVITHAYEGGHPDHDATAFGVHAAQSIVARERGDPPQVLEVPLYHSRQGEMTTQVFPADQEQALPDLVLVLSPQAREAKRRMFAAHKSQHHVLAWFDTTVERIRLAPRYDFSQLPNGGELHYERMDWGLTGQEWLALAVDACHELGLPECL